MRIASCFVFSFDEGRDRKVRIELKDIGDYDMFNMKSTMSAVILAAGLVGIAPHLAAQALNYHGTFTLPVEARFGNVVLQPGTYDVRTMEGAKGIRITGARKEVTILAARAEAQDETEKNKMVLVENNGVYTLQSFE